MKCLPCTLFIFSILLGLSCRRSEKLNVPQQPDPKMDELETYIYENITRKYGMVIKYKFHYGNAYGNNVVPPIKELVKPYVKFIEQYWIQPYLLIKEGKSYFSTYAPNELVLSAMQAYRGTGEPDFSGLASNGTYVLVGHVNNYDLRDPAWTRSALYLLTHEFGHTQHQVFAFPTEWETLSVGHRMGMQNHEALPNGFVTGYAGSNAGEDFAETVSQFLFSPKTGLPRLKIQNCNHLPAFSRGTCETLNKGRKTVLKKMEAVKKFYQAYGNINLEELRDSMRVVQTPLLYAP